MTERANDASSVAPADVAAALRGSSGPARDAGLSPGSLQQALSALETRCNVCRLVSLHDVRNVLPERPLDPGEIAALLRGLADHGLALIDAEARAAPAAEASPARHRA